MARGVDEARARQLVLEVDQSRLLDVLERVIDVGVEALNDVPPTLTHLQTDRDGPLDRVKGSGKHTAACLDVEHRDEVAELLIPVAVRFLDVRFLDLDHNTNQVGLRRHNSGRGKSITWFLPGKERVVACVMEGCKIREAVRQHTQGTYDFIDVTLSQDDVDLRLDHGPHSIDNRRIRQQFPSLEVVQHFRSPPHGLWNL